MTTITEKDKGFYGGLLTALGVIHIFDQPVIIDEIMGTLDEESQNELVKWAKKNDEYEWSGLKEWKEKQ